MHFCPTRKPYRPRYTAVHVRQTVSLWSTAFELAHCPRFRNILSDRCASRSRSLSFSFSLFRYPRDPLVSTSLSRSYYFNRFCCDSRIWKLYFLSFLGRFEICYFWTVWKWKWSTWMVIGKWRLDRICNL